MLASTMLLLRLCYFSDFRSLISNFGSLTQVGDMEKDSRPPNDNRPSNNNRTSNNNVANGVA